MLEMLFDDFRRGHWGVFFAVFYGAADCVWEDLS